MDKRMLVLALFAIFAGILVGGCSETEQETIENTVVDFYSAYNAEDWEVCLGHVYDAKNVGASELQSAYEKYRAASGDVTVDGVDNINITGSSASADVTITYDGHSETQRWSFVKKNGDWKIIPFAKG